MKKLPESPRQVGINAHLLSREATYRSAGIHGYIYNLIQKLPAVQPDSQLQYTVFVGEGEIQPTDRLQVRRSSWPTGRPAARILWEQVALPWQPMDLLHSMAFVSPFFSRWPSVITVYDLSFVHYPEVYTAGRRAYLRLLGRLSCQRAERILAISESTRRDLVKQWKLPAAKIDLAYPGVGEQFRPLLAEEIAAFRQRHQLPARFILHLGTLQPRKNLIRLVQAYGRLRALHNHTKLILAGGEGWLYQEILAEIEKLDLQNDILLPGYVAAEDLPLWYNAATLLAFPSLYEGFGLPVVEAMACGTPVVTSNVSSMPEAAGAAAALVDPYDTDTLAQILHQTLADQDLQEEMRAKGYQQAAQFTWQQTAAATVTAYQRALAGAA